MPPSTFEYDYSPEHEAMSQRGRVGDRLLQEVDVVPEKHSAQERLDLNGAYIRVDSQNPGKVLGVSRTDGTTVQCGWKNGELIQVTEADTRTGESSTWNKQGNKWVSHILGTECTRDDVSIDRDGRLNFGTTSGGMLSVATDGSSVLTKPDRSKVETDSYGIIQKISNARGDQRTFEYEDGKISKVNDVTKSGGTRSWDAKDITVHPDGDLVYRRADGSEVVEKSNFSHSESESPTIQDARAGLTDAMSKHVGPERMERMGQLMDRFETRMSDRAYIRKLAGHDASQVDSEIEKTVVQTYDHLSELVALNPPTQRFDQPTRAKFAENFLFHAGKPTSVDQGFNRTCWIESGQIAGGLVT
jgi:hypothetical protein